MISYNAIQERVSVVQSPKPYSGPSIVPTHCWNARTVYIVEDDDSLREGLLNLLQSVGLRTAAFSTATELLSVDLPDTASCLLVDIRLPGLSGLDFQSRLVGANVRVPIIFMTGHADVPVTVKAMKAGAVDFLMKPFCDRDLLDAVTRAIKLHDAYVDQGHRITETVSRFKTLSQREREVMGLVTAGLMNKQVAARIGVVEATVKIYRGHVMKKMKAKSLADLVRMAELLQMSAA